MTQPDTYSIEEEVPRKAAAWQGICDVRVKIDDSVQKWPGKVTQVGLIVEEGLADAVRRGDATWASITVTTLSDHDIHVSVEDDGNGPGEGRLGSEARLSSRPPMGAGNWNRHLMVPYSPRS